MAIDDNPTWNDLSDLFLMLGDTAYDIAEGKSADEIAKSSIVAFDKRFDDTKAKKLVTLFKRIEDLSNDPVWLAEQHRIQDELADRLTTVFADNIERLLTEDNTNAKGTVSDE
jgi:hypothetical protein